MPQLSLAEMRLIDKMVRKDKKKPVDAWRALTKARGAVRTKAKKLKKSSLKKMKRLSKNTVYQYCNGETHQVGTKEKRGRGGILTKADLRALMNARRRLIKRAKNEQRVRYEDVIKEANLDKDVSQVVVERALRTEGVRYRPARKKIYLSERDAMVRLLTMKAWSKKTKAFWSTRVHAFIDNKAWPIPLTPAQRSKYNATKVVGHLRLPSEGTDQGSTQPRTAHSLLGVPSVNICAAVAKDRLIMWEDCGKKWNGAAAAAMYKGPLTAALRRAWGLRKSYMIVEDGDRKGYQSNKGKQGKIAAGIKAMVLPPRTPSMMPLDASLWTRIDDRMCKTAPAGVESKAEFLARLEATARALPRGCVAKAIGRTRANILAIIDAKGYHPKND